MKSLLVRPVGIWIRVSTDMQVEGESPENHERRAREYASSKGWQVVEVYRLDGVSGSASLDHAEAQRMFRDLDRGRITALIASKFARFSRNGISFRQLYQRFKAAKADLISLDESIDTSTPAGELMLGLIADLAEWERKEISTRVRSSIRPRAQAGKPLGGKAPYGYQWVEGKLIPHTEEAPIRRQIHELYIVHKRARTVATLLNQAGHRTRPGKLWTDTHIRWLIADTSAKGLHRKNYSSLRAPEFRKQRKTESEIVYAPIEPIVDPAVWDQAFAIRTHVRSQNFCYNKRSPHLFTGILRCGCGRKMYQREYDHRYRCTTSGGCWNSISSKRLEEGFVNGWQQLTTEAWVEGYLAAAAELRQAKERQLQLLEEAEQQAKGIIQKAFELFAAGHLPSQRYQIVCEPHEAKLKELEQEIPSLKSELEILRDTQLNREAILHETRMVATQWTSWTTEEKRQFLESKSLTIRSELRKELHYELCYFPSTLNTANGQRTLHAASRP